MDQVLESDIGDVSFWAERWNRLNASTTAFGGYGKAETWNAMAHIYGKNQHREDVDERFDETFTRLAEAGFRFEGSRILDVGCGPGRYAREFARRGALVVGIDISENMIGRLEAECTPEERVRIITICADWKDVSLAHCNFTKAFDLVFANMTPAVSGPEPFLKLMQASKRWCWFRGWAGPRGNTLMEQLHRAIGDTSPQPFCGNFILAWNLACAAGYFPDTVFETVRWAQRTPVDEAVAFFTTFFRRKNTAIPDEELSGRIFALLRENAVDGIIENTVTGRTGSMLWSVDG